MKSRLLAALLLCGGLLLPAAASAVPLDWNTLVWGAGSMSNAYLLSNGVTVTITFTQPGGTVGVFENSSPAEDCSIPAQCPTNFFGTSHDLSLVFNPSAGTPIVTSPILLTLAFSSPVTTLVFEISDIDFSVGLAGNPGTHRRDQVTITSDAGAPTLSFKTAAPRSFSIAGNVATANCTVNPEPSCNPATDTVAAVPPVAHNPNPDAGTVVVDFGALSVSTVTITYTEAGNGTDPSGRGIGLLANLTLTPVELMGFTVD